MIVFADAPGCIYSHIDASIASSGGWSQILTDRSRPAPVKQGHSAVDMATVGP